MAASAQRIADLEARTYVTEIWCPSPASEVLQSLHRPMPDPEPLPEPEPEAEL